MSITISEKIVKLIGNMRNLWSEGTGVTLSIFDHALANKRNFQLLGNLANKIETEGKHETFMKALKQAAWDCCAVNMRKNADNVWSCKTDTKQLESIGLTGAIALKQLKDKGLKSFIPKAVKKSKGKGGSKNAASLSGIKLLASTLGNALDAMGSEASTVSQAAPYISELTDLMVRLKKELSLAGMSGMADEFDVVLKAQADMYKAGDPLEDINADDNVSGIVLELPAPTGTENKEAKRVPTGLDKIAEYSKGTLSAVLYQAEVGFSQKIHLYENGVLIYEEPCYLANLEAAEFHLKRMVEEGYRYAS